MGAQMWDRKVWHTWGCQLTQVGWKEKPQMPSEHKAGTKPEKGPPLRMGPSHRCQKSRRAIKSRANSWMAEQVMADGEEEI